MHHPWNDPSYRAISAVRRALQEGKKPAALAAKGHQLVVAAVAVAQAQEFVCQDAAFQKGLELVRQQPNLAAVSPKRPPL